MKSPEFCVKELRRSADDRCRWTKAQRLRQGGERHRCGDPAQRLGGGERHRASAGYAAHYDTPLRAPLPAILCPTRPVTYLLYQALTPVLALVLCFAVSLGVTFALSLPNLTLPLFLVLLVGALAYLKYGPSERTMSTPIPPAWRRCSRTAEAAHAALPQRRLLPLSGRRRRSIYAGRQGLPQALSSARRSPSSASTAWAAETSALILPGKGARWNGRLLDAINSSFENSERKTCYDKVDGLVHFPGDQRAFKQGVAVCAVPASPASGRFICPTGRITASTMKI